MRRITTLLLLFVLTINPISAAKSEVILLTDEISIACNGGTYTVWMPAGYLTKDNGCTGSLVIDSSVKYIGLSAFANSKITSLVIPNSVIDIGTKAFENNLFLKSVVFPNSIKSIGDWAFSYTGLTSIVIPGNSLKSIGYFAFWGTALVSVDIPHSVETAIEAFGTNGALKTIIYCGTVRNFPVSPTCPPERKAIIDAAAKAEKAIIDAAAKAEAEARAAAAYSCLQPPDTYGTEPIWKTSANKDLKYVVSWAFRDPEKCIVGIAEKKSYNSYNFRFGSDEFPTTWTVTRDAEMVLVSAETEFPLKLLKALPRVDNETSQRNFFQTNKQFVVRADIKIKRGANYTEESISGSYGLAQLWGDWFSKNQGIYPTDCKPVNMTTQKSDISINWKILESGLNPKIEISVQEPNNCIFLIHTGPLEPLTNNVNFHKYEKSISQSQFSFDEGPGSLFFNSILSSSDRLIQIGLGEFASETPERLEYYHFNELRSKIDRFPSKVLNHSDSVLVKDNAIKISSTIDGSNIDASVKDYVTVYFGIYQWSFESSGFVSSGWNVTYSGNSWTARYRQGSSIPGGNYYKYSTRAIKIPFADLFLSAEVKAAASAKAAAEKAAAELKAKQEAEAKALASAAAEKLAADLLLKQIQDRENSKIAKQKEIDSGLVELRNSLIELGRKYPSLKKGGDSFYGFNGLIDRLEDHNEMFAKFDLDYKYEYYLKIAEEVRVFIEKSSNSVKTITCVKGKVSKKVTEIKPKCPTGYKKK